MIEFSSYPINGDDEVMVVSLSGQLDTDAAGTFFDRLDEQISAGHHKLVFECSQLDHISSLGFGMMVRAHTRVQKEGGGVRFAGLNGFVKEAFHVVGFHKLFQVFDSVDEAARSF